ncbi:MAG: hypothetical protein ACI835_001179 [Planctomycetota bacterium]|jgi:hypothetical protein
MRRNVAQTEGLGNLIMTRAAVGERQCSGQSALALPIFVVACLALFALAMLRAGSPGTRSLAIGPESVGDQALIPDSTAGADDSLRPQRTAVEVMVRGGREFLNAFGPERSQAFRVIDRSGHAPIAGALITLLGQDHERTATTDEDGRAALDWPAALAAVLRVEHPEYADITRPRLRSSEDEIVIELDPGGRIEGRLVTTDGAALPEGIQVFLWMHGAKGPRGEERARTTPERVAFSFGDLEGGVYSLVAMSGRTRLAIVTGVQVDAEQSVYVALPLSKPGSVEVRVLERTSERPLPESMVHMTPVTQGLHDSLTESSIQERLSGESGELRFESLPVGPNVVEARTPWGAVVTKTIEVVSGENPELVLHIAPSGVLAGVVLGSDGAPVEGARVMFAISRETESQKWSSPSPPAIGESGFLERAESDALGQFEFEAVPSKETLLVAAWPPGGAVAANGDLGSFQSTVKLGPGEANRNLRIELAVGGALIARVQDENGDPLVARVALQTMVGKAWMKWDAESTNSAGEVHFANVPMGRMQVSVEAAGYRRSEQKTTIAALEQGVIELDVTLTPACRLEGWVVDEDGNAIWAARVRAEMKLGEDVRRRGKGVDEYGRFVIEDLQPGVWSLKVEAMGWRMLVPEPVRLMLPEQSFASFVMTPDPLTRPGRVSGEVVAKGNGRALRELKWNSLRGGVLSVDGTQFSITGMRPGMVKLVPEAPGFERRGFARFDLAPGADIDLGRLELRRVTKLDVSLRDAQGNSVHRAKVWLEKPGADATKNQKAAGAYIRLKAIGRDGLFRASQATQGQWVLRAKFSDGSKASKNLKLSRSAQKVTLTLDADAKNKSKAGSSKRAKR